MSATYIHPVNLSREFAMARFAQPQFASFPRVTAGSVSTLKQDTGSALDGSRTLAGMLLAAALAALLAVADQLITTWTDGHLLAAWVALWTVAFAALALLVPSLRHIAAHLSVGVFVRWERWKARREEARMWELACHDPRVVEEIRVAMGHKLTN
jgi:hypothetical protein